MRLSRPVALMFLNFTMIAGLAGALVPLVVHLLSRSRSREVQWGAMLFLDHAQASMLSSARLRQWIMLGLRMLIVAALAIALAQPVFRGRWGAASREGRVAAVIVLDCSASMGVDENGKSRLELARSAVLGILETLRESRVAVLALGSQDVEPMGQPTTDLQQLAQQVMSISESGGRADLATGLKRGADILDRMPEAVRELYVVCDRQASTWREAGTAAFRESWAARASGRRFFVVPVGTDKSDNLAIESLELTSPTAIADMPAEIQVKVRNYGRSTRSGAELKVEDKLVSVSARPGETAVVHVPARYHLPGARVVSASLSGAGARFDDRMQSAIDVIEPVRVLIVSGDERGMALQNESDFLRIALAPRTAEAAAKGDASARVAPGDPCQVEVVPYERWNEDQIRQYQVVVLANVPQVTQSQAIALEQYTYEGGGLWIAPGNLTRIENFNALLYRDGTGIMPAKLLAPTAEDGAEATTIQGISDFDHPVFQFLKGRPDPVPAAMIGRYFPAEPRTRGARVLAQYASGKPFLIESTGARTRIVLLTTPLDCDWGTLPLSNFYLPLMQSLARYLAAGMVTDRNVWPGQPLVARLGPMHEIRKAEVRGPLDARELQWTAVPVSRGEVRYLQTQRPGVYEMRLEGTMPAWARRMMFVVQTPRSESDLTPLTPQQWRDLSQSLGFQVVDPAREQIAGVILSARAGRELWLVLAAAVIGLCVVEVALSRRWGAEGAA